MTRVYELDGRNFSTLEEFASHFSQRVLRDNQWNGNLDAFNDILRGGFGTPEEGFTIRFTHTHEAQAALGYAETIRWLEHKVTTCHDSNVSSVVEDLAMARAHEGPTLFDLVLETIREHGPGGSEAKDNVILELR